VRLILRKSDQKPPNSLESEAIGRISTQPRRILNRGLHNLAILQQPAEINQRSHVDAISPIHIGKRSYACTICGYRHLAGPRQLRTGGGSALAAEANIEKLATKTKAPRHTIRISPNYIEIISYNRKSRGAMPRMEGRITACADGLTS
jgi:hypothetical protein